MMLRLLSGIITVGCLIKWPLIVGPVILTSIIVVCIWILVAYRGKPVDGKSPPVMTGPGGDYLKAWPPAKGDSDAA